MSLNEMMDYDAAQLVSTTELGETISYTPYGGTARTINAVVFRDGNEPLPNSGVMGISVRIFVRNHATLGVENPKENGDRVVLATTYGSATTKTMIVSNIIAQDAGGWFLQLR